MGSVIQNALQRLFCIAVGKSAALRITLLVQYYEDSTLSGVLTASASLRNCNCYLRGNSFETVKVHKYHCANSAVSQAAKMFSFAPIFF